MRAASSFIALIAISGATAIPFLVPRITARGVADDAAGILKELLKIIGVATENNNNAWDIEAHPNMCAIYMKTQGGGNCYASVRCKDQEKREYKDKEDFKECRHMGKNTFNDPGIGPFSIVFTRKDDDCYPKGGLCGPMLALEYVGNYHEIDVAALSGDSGKRSGPCKADCWDATPDEHPDVKNICKISDRFNEDGINSDTCGMPMIGKNYGEGNLDSEVPDNEAQYAPGTCRVHVKQYQKVDPAADPKTNEDADYHLSVNIYDQNEDGIAWVAKERAPAGQAVEVVYGFPAKLLVTAQGVDDDPVLFADGDEKWDSGDAAHKCKFGGYDGGKRQGECFFAC
ncbi:MAG: hypothetical protein Q9174_002046 [Haloplaca sp. 1 TL-2023]